MLILLGIIKTSTNCNKVIIVQTIIIDVDSPAHAQGNSLSLKAQIQKQYALQKIYLNNKIISDNITIRTAS